MAKKMNHTTIYPILLLSILCLVFGVIEKTCFKHYTFTLVFSLCYFFRLLLNTVNLKLINQAQKEHLNIMFNKNSLKVYDKQTEIITAIVFLILGISLIPLMRSGFWMTDKTYLGRPQHLIDEFRATNDLLQVNYEVKNQKEIKRGTGYCISATPSKVVLLENGHWTILDHTQSVINKVIPIHTGKQFRFKATNFFAINADSLNQLVQEHPIIDIQITNNHNFKIIRNNTVETIKKFQQKYLDDILFQAVDNTIEIDTFTTPINASQIATLQQQIVLLLSVQAQKYQLYEAQQHQMLQLQKTYTNSPISQKKHLMTQIRDLEKLKPPSSITPKIAHIKTQIDMLQNQDFINHTMQEIDVDLMNWIKLEETRQTAFTGIITKIIIHDMKHFRNI